VRTHWGGCFAAGDWNFVEFAKDRFPTRHADCAPTQLLTWFEKIKNLCSMKDVAGDNPTPSFWSYSKMTHHGQVYSRLDRVYRPSLGWSDGAVTPMATNWSDHRMIITTIHVRKPKIEKATPASRLPSMETLEKTQRFWPAVLLGWEAMTKGGPITLESWKIFKDLVLSTGIKEAKAMKSSGKKDWIATLQNKSIPPEELMSAVTWANRQLWAKRTPAARTPPEWLAAIPGYVVPLKQSKHFKPSRDSPWQVPTQRYAGAPTVDTSGALVFKRPAEAKRVADMLQERMDHLEKSTKAKWEKMCRTHTSEWYKQSSNKELDERGSRASVSVEGLRRPDEDIARTDLTGMTAVARDYFYHLHTPEPLNLECKKAQSTLLEEIRRQDAVNQNPALEDIIDRPFTEEEMRALLLKMPNTAPGPDGIHYGFWKKLIKVLDSLQDRDTLPRTFWSIFANVTEDIAKRGSSCAVFKNANISLFYKKGDPTLVSNYRPISSMNTDCKMYTNLLNNRLAPWAVAKLHPDQKGFVPGRLMNKLR